MNFHEIGSAIRAARQSQNISQSGLAKKLGMSRATISGVENGTFTELGIRKFTAICTSLGCELNVVTRGHAPTYHELKRAREAEQRTALLKPPLKSPAKSDAT